MKTIKNKRTPHFFIYHTPTRAINLNDINEPNKAGNQSPSLFIKGENTFGKEITTAINPIIAAMVSNTGRLRITGNCKFSVFGFKIVFQYLNFNALI